MSNEKTKGSRDMDEQERYIVVCKPILDTLSTQVGDIHKALFIGNGKPAINVQLERGAATMEKHAGFFKAFFWWAGSVSLGCVIALLTEVIKHFRG